MNQLELLTSPAAAQLAAGVLIVPIGSTEQHGPHLPLGTDSHLAAELSARLAARLPGSVVAPLIPYGSSGEHAGVAGTLSIGQEALELLLVELGRSASISFNHQVFVSGHGGNAGPVTRAAARLQAESRDVLVWMPQWEGDAHAGRTETSMQLQLHPDAVLRDRFEPGNSAPIARLLPELLAGGVLAVSANGILGDPNGATAEEGALLLDQLTDDLVAAVRAWASPTEDQVAP